MGFIRGGETIQIKRRTATGVNEVGLPTYTEQVITVRDVLIAIGTTSEQVDPARDAQDATVTLYFPNGTVIDANDVFIVRGSRWVKDGEAMEWVSPFPATEAGVVVPIRRRRG